jgi:hypothetical protein
MTPSKGMPSPRQETGKFLFLKNGPSEQEKRQQKFCFKDNNASQHFLNGSKSARNLNSERKDWEPMKNIINCMNNPSALRVNTESTPTKKDPM